jgi:hypothetical protein
MDALVNDDNKVTYCVSSKRCYNKVATAPRRNNTYPSVNKTTCLPWEKDGENREDDVNNSMSILLDGITEEGGALCNKYCGEGNGICKTKIADHIAA